MSGLLLGVAGTYFVTPYIKKPLLKHEEKFLWTSSEISHLQKIAYEMIDQGRGVNTLASVLDENRYGPAASEAKLVVLDVFERCGIYDAISYPLAAAAARDTDKEVRAKALRKYDEMLNRAACTHLSMLVLHLHEESDEELLKTKIEFLCRRAYLSFNEIQEILREEGIEAVKQSFQDRLQEPYIDIKETMYDVVP